MKKGRNIYADVFLRGEIVGQIMDAAVIRHFKKNETITASGSIENFFNIIIQGHTGMFFIKKSGREVCFDLNYDEEYVSSYGSFVLREPSFFELRAIENTILLSISYENLYKEIYEKTEMGYHTGRRAMETIYMYTEKRLIEFYSQPAEERYKTLIAKSSNILNRTPQKYLASYLGVTPQSFSRIKKTIMKDQL